MEMEKTVWQRVVELKPKDNRHVGVANTLTKDEIRTIIATMEYFNVSPEAIGQDLSDLGFCRYRVFDWLGMRIQSDQELYGEEATKVMVHSFLKSEGDVDKFIADLRATDYDCDHSWEAIKLS
jgi:hypothetical protein